MTGYKCKHETQQKNQTQTLNQPIWPERYIRSKLLFWWETYVQQWTVKDCWWCFCMMTPCLSSSCNLVYFIWCKFLGGDRDGLIGINKQKVKRKDNGRKHVLFQWIGLEITIGHISHSAVWSWTRMSLYCGKRLLICTYILLNTYIKNGKNTQK